ncbi:CAP domain-containing protein [Peptococcaceae bacterium 1198_IL3148]
MTLRYKALVSVLATLLAFATVPLISAEAADNGTIRQQVLYQFNPTKLQVNQTDWQPNPVWYNSYRSNFVYWQPTYGEEVNQPQTQQPQPEQPESNTNTVIDTGTPTTTNTSTPDNQIAQQPVPKETTDTSNSAFQSKVVELVNQERSKAGLQPGVVKADLTNVAQLKAEDMANNNYFSHTSPTYGSPFDMMKQFGINYSYAGENIAVGYSTPESVMEGWMNSEGHKKNILNPNFTEIGVGFTTNGYYWVQEFAKR